MGFWEMAYVYEWIDKEMLKQAVITETNPFGEVYKEKYKRMTGEDYAK